MTVLGKRLGGRYQMIQRVGGGGMAVVYKARDTVSGRYVAIKVLNEALSYDQAFIRRFNREVRAAGSLSHPHVVQVYNAGREGHTYYMVMEYIEGPTLMELILKRKRIPPREAVSIAIQVLNGLAHAHENGIVHRDIKPHNIMATPGGRFKLTDFGISRSTRSPTITKTGYVMGSAHYFSPEQATGKEVSYPSDLYSLGVVLFEMITGRLPFDGDEALAIALQHLQEPVPDPRRFAPGISESLCQVIYRALEKSPENRFPTAREMCAALQAIYNEEAGSSPPYWETNPPVQQAIGRQGRPADRQVLQATGSRRQAHRKSRQKKWIALLTTLAILLILWLSFSVFDHNRSSRSEDEETRGSPSSTATAKSVSSETQQQTKTDYNWKKHIGETNNPHFIQYSSNRVGDGRYEVSLKTDLSPRFYYDILIYDRKGKKVINGIPVATPFGGEGFKTVRFQVKVSDPPKQGLIKIQLYQQNQKATKILEKIQE